MINISADCTGCGACVQKCPRKCIKLTEDKEGFLYPIIEIDKCVNCNMCNGVCPVFKNVTYDITYQRAYAAVHKDRDVLNRSTSGGAFSAIANEILSRGGVVYGCAYQPPLKAVHIRIDNLLDLTRLNGSKYVQSLIDDCYKKAECDLKEGKWVLFSGTPCQIAGLKSYLNQDYEKLFTVDIVCHGVASQACFDKYIQWYEHKNNMIVNNFDFRSKKNSGWSIAGISTGIDAKSGKSCSKKVFYFDEYYYFYFLKSAIYRESCYKCKYTNLSRAGDFTLGDLWGAERFNLPFSVVDGCSLILANSKKATELLELLPIYLKEISVNSAIADNEQLRQPSKRPAIRESLLTQFRELDAEQIQKIFKKTYRAMRFKAKCKYLVPKSLRHMLLMLKS